MRHVRADLRSGLYGDVCTDRRGSWTLGNMQYVAADRSLYESLDSINCM